MTSAMSFHPQIYLLDGIDLVVNYSQLDQINLQFCVSHQISPLMTGAKNIFFKNFCMNAEKKNDSLDSEPAVNCVIFNAVALMTAARDTF